MRYKLFLLIYCIASLFVSCDTNDDIELDYYYLNTIEVPSFVYTEYKKLLPEDHIYQQNEYDSYRYGYSDYKINTITYVGNETYNISVKHKYQVYIKYGMGSSYSLKEERYVTEGKNYKIKIYNNGLIDFIEVN